MFDSLFLRQFSIITLTVLLTGCTVHPPGEGEERDAVTRLGKSFEKRGDVRVVVPLSDKPTPDQLVKYALLNSADLEQKYWTWRAAIEQIPQDGTQSTNLNIAAGTNITNGHASWSSSTVTLGNDPMTDIKWPGKLDAAATQSLENARAAGRRFLKAKYELRSKVLGAYYDYAFNAELIRLEQSNLQLLQTFAATTEARNQSGSAGQQDVLKAQTEVDISGNDIASMKSQLPGECATINALLGRTTDAPLPLPDQLPGMRLIEYSDAELVSMAIRLNPELIALADESRGRQQGVRLAKLQYIPDFNLSAGTDLAGIAQSLLAQATIPVFRYQALNAAIDQAQANLRASEAMRRQTASDLSSQVVTDINVIKNAERQIDLFEHAILPRSRQAVELGRSAYVTGHFTLLELLDNQRALIALERLVVNLKSLHEKHLDDLEAITTIDLSQKPPEPTVDTGK